MRIAGNCLVVFLSIAALGAEKGKFAAGRADSYPNRQTISRLTIAAAPIETDEEARPAFGKLNPHEHGVLPVLVVMQNDGQQTLSLDRLRVELITPDRGRVEATPAGEVRYLGGGRRATLGQSPIPSGSPRVKRPKNRLDAEEIQARAFVARMLPPGDFAFGFFYFQAGYRRGLKLYVTGIREAGTGNELFYFEIPLDK